MASKRFERLRREVYEEYRRKGFGKERAAYVAESTAGRVARRKRAHRNPPAERHCSLCGASSHDKRTCPRRRPEERAPRGPRLSASAPRPNPRSTASSRRAGRPRPIRRNPDDLSSAMRVSKLTNGRVGEVVELSERERKLPRYVAVVGDMVDVTYRPPEGSKRGRSDYRHESGDCGELRPKAKERPVVGADPVTKRLVVVPGKSPMRLTRRGLVG